MLYQKAELVPTRLAYGQALAELGTKYPKLVALDAEVKNSTYAELFAKKFPERFFEMYISEQNMIGAGLGLSKCDKIPFVSTFAAFLTRAYDQIRMASYSAPNLKICGSHAGVSIGEDGSSQMGLEDMAMMRALPGSTVLYPCDAVSTFKLVEQMVKHKGLDYLRTSRPATAVIYDNSEEFPLGGSKILRQSPFDKVTVVTAGITVFEALKASDELGNVRVIDAYSVKPIDKAGLIKAGKATNGKIMVVEDHRVEGGLGSAVLEAVAQEGFKVYQLGVTKIPGSGKMAELLKWEEIDAEAIGKMVKSLIK
ncbi:MAG: transketolase C-terminal domain-containing protein [Patescibacteria group bacterium]